MGTKADMYSMRKKIDICSLDKKDGHVQIKRKIDTYSNFKKRLTYIYLIKKKKIRHIFK